MLKISIFILGIFIGLPNSYAGLHPSVLMFNGWDLDQCEKQVDKIQYKIGANDIQIMPTVRFKLSEKNQVEYFCLEKEQCLPFNSSTLKVFHQKIVSCINYALNNNIKVFYTPHLDATWDKYIWRNQLVFNPQKKYNSISYADIFFSFLSLINAPIEISLQGEMGATVFTYPQKYLNILQKIKRINPEHLVGVSFNYNVIAGGVFLHWNQYWSFKKLMHTTDFIGLSAYAPIPVKLRAKDLANSYHSLKKSLARKLTPLPKDKNIIYIETGIGGGSYQNDGTSKAKTPKAAAKNPYAGIWDVNDMKNHPWLDQRMQNFRFLFHQKMIEFLKTNQLNITKAYLWNANSWDPLGIYQNNEVFEDHKIIQMIKNQY